ncbi:MAG: pilus (MSHA type) biogenesis protein MshL [Gammaproteobacteria bacterium]|nr:pilus (MSHA type) biogenesis protein MshL [Gammaproteobacteria bacterium]MBU1646987.1 pilus (MSHA type) biogenesis protein MshL [Gammaproteobacteria bacterium]MBU1972499.1 pilus (MSHA type) biogenesis protein MshL [Gammaproteobacteria bacterium]
MNRMTTTSPRTIAGMAVAVAMAALAGCSSAPVQTPSSGHLRAEEPRATPASIPAPVQNTVSLTAPKAAPRVETYSVVVKDVRVQELLFALARDAKLNVDIHPGLAGTVTLNAIDQTLQQLLSRIAKQVDMRWEIDGPNLIVMPDSPFLRNYKVDYVNMSRDVTGTVAINTQIASTSTGATAGGGAATGGGNNSSTTVSSKAKNNFWESVEKNLKDILRETDKILPEGSSETVTERLDQQQTTGTGAPQAAGGRGGANAQPSIAGSPNAAALQQQGTTVVRRTTFREAASVIVNPEAGVIVVRATSRQHEKVQEYLDQVLTNTRRQVMIEATIAEIKLSDQYQQGVNWQSLRSLFNPNTAGFSVGQLPGALSAAGAADPALAAAGTGLLLNYINPVYGISGTLKLLETFGNVKVLSSPKISVLNNQTAMLKVVENIVYFTIKSDTTTTAAGPSQTTVTTTPNSVSVGLVMTVTPQISDTETILLNVRPTISSLKGLGKADPNPSIPAGIQNLVPEIQTREMESMLRLTNGEIAVMGGLMEDRLDNKTDAVPFFSKIPGIGTFFTQRNDVTTKTELVIFLKPTIIRDPSVAGDYRSFAGQLPNKDFFANNPGPKPPHIEVDGGQTR